MSEKIEVLTSLKSWKEYGEITLRMAGIPDYKVDAWLLMEYVCNINKSYYYLHMDRPMDKSDAIEYQKLIDRRSRHVPLQYLTREAWFYDQPFLVNEAVLIPRQDTETLVEESLQYLKPHNSVLDLCTGSGCVILTLIRHASVIGTGSDVSEEALTVAMENANRQKVNNCAFILSDLFDKINGTYDMITANPPYIPTRDIKGLMREVSEHEPILALDGHEDGLYFYRKIADEARGYLKSGGRLVMEIGYDQADLVKDILFQNGYRDIKIIRDLAGLPRVMSARWS